VLLPAKSRIRRADSRASTASRRHRHRPRSIRPRCRREGTSGPDTPNCSPTSSVRVPVDHRTAFEIAGRGTAREASLVLSCRAAELAPWLGQRLASSPSKPNRLRLTDTSEVSTGSDVGQCLRPIEAVRRFAATLRSWPAAAPLDQLPGLPSSSLSLTIDLTTIWVLHRSKHCVGVSRGGENPAGRNLRPFRRPTRTAAEAPPLGQHQRSQAPTRAEGPESTLVMLFGTQIELIPHLRYQLLPHRAARDLVNLPIFVGVTKPNALRLICSELLLDHLRVPTGYPSAHIGSY
jgi:hypothetical protein